MHSEWLQILTTSVGTNLNILWQFDNTRSLQDRFQTAVTSGEPVTWTISYGGSTYTKSGTWRFSSSAGDMSTRFASSSGGSQFSNDDGMWGGGTGIVNGDYPNIIPSDFWGHGNYNSGDYTCGRAFLGSSSPSGLSVTGNLMYLRMQAGATLAPTMRSSPIASATPGMFAQTISHNEFYVVETYVWWQRLHINERRTHKTPSSRPSTT